MWTLTLADGSQWSAFEFGVTTDRSILRVGLTTKSIDKAVVAFTDPRKTSCIKGTDGIRNREYSGYIYLDSLFRNEDDQCTLRLAREGIA